MSCSHAHAITARKWERTLFEVRPGFPLSRLTASSYTQSRNARISFRPSFSMGIEFPQRVHFLRVVEYSSQVLCAGFPERRYLATAVSRVVGIDELHAAGVRFSARSSSTSGTIGHRADSVKAENCPSAMIIWTDRRWCLTERSEARVAEPTFGATYARWLRQALIALFAKSRLLGHMGSLRSQVRTFCPESFGTKRFLHPDGYSCVT